MHCKAQMLVIQNISVNGFQSLCRLCEWVCECRVSYSIGRIHANGCCKRISYRKWGYFHSTFIRKIFFLVNCKMVFGLATCLSELVLLCSGFWVGGFGLVFHSCKSNLGDKAGKTRLAHKKIRMKWNQFRSFCHWNFLEQWMKWRFQHKMETCMHTNFHKFGKEDLLWRFHSLFCSVDENIFRMLPIHFIIDKINQESVKSAFSLVS